MSRPLTPDEIVTLSVFQAKEIAFAKDATRRLHLLLDRIDDFTHKADTPQDVTAAIREFLNEKL